MGKLAILRLCILGVFFLSMVLGFVNEGFTFSSLLWGIFMMLGASITLAIHNYYQSKEGGKE